MNYESIYPFWSHLTTNEKAYVEQSCFKETFEKGALIYRSEETCKGLMSVLSGCLRVYILSDEGREVTLFRVNAGEVCVLSASCLMDTIDFDIMIEAIETTEVLVLPTMALNHIMENNPYAELYLYKTATEKFSEVMWTMQQILFKRTDQRVAGFIWDEFTRSGSETLLITHDEIARSIGSAREVVTRVLKYLASHDVIALSRGKILITDKEKLKTFL